MRGQRGKRSWIAEGLVVTLLSSTWLFYPGKGWGQAVPAPGAASVNPGIISNQNRQNQEQIRELNDQTLQGPPVVAPPVPEGVIGPSGGATFVLKSVVFDNSAFFPKDQLDAIAQPYIGTKVDLSQIQRIVKAVNDLYAERGLVTDTAYLPPQNLKSGVLHIAIVEGKLGKLNVNGISRLNDDFVRAHIPVNPGEVVDVPALTQSVAGFNKSGVAQIQASLQSGNSFGLTDIDLAIVEPPAISVNLFGDNQGVESVGKYEGGFLIQGYSPLGIDDRLTLYGVGSQGNLDGNVAYSIPWNIWNGRVGLSYTRGQIYVLQGPFSDLNIKGQSENAAVNIAQPIFVNSNWSLIANSAFSYNVASSTQSGTLITDNKTNKETVGFAAGYTNETFSVSVSPTYSLAQTSFLVTDGQQHFSLYNGSYSGTLRLPSDFIVTVGGAFQVSSSQLIAGDQLFQLGGPTSVRGYTTTIVAGATGYYTDLELHHNLNFALQGLDAFAFYDRGSVYSTSPSVVTLNSVGAGLSYDYNSRVVAEISVGVPLDHIVSNQPPCEVYFRLTTKFSTADLAKLNLGTAPN